MKQGMSLVFGLVLFFVCAATALSYSAPTMLPKNTPLTALETLQIVHIAGCDCTPLATLHKAEAPRPEFAGENSVRTPAEAEEMPDEFRRTGTVAQ